MCRLNLTWVSFSCHSSSIASFWAAAFRSFKPRSPCRPNIASAPNPSDLEKERIPDLFFFSRRHCRRLTTLANFGIVGQLLAAPATRVLQICQNSGGDQNSRPIRLKMPQYSRCGRIDIHLELPELPVVLLLHSRASDRHQVRSTKVEDHFWLEYLAFPFRNGVQTRLL